MNTHWHELELLSEVPAKPRHRTPLLFVHGAYMGAWCWQEHFLPWFAERGWASYALSLSGHGGSRQSTQLEAFSINDYIGDLAATIKRLPEAPVLIGHSMGGMVVQKYLERARVPAVALICAVPPQGLWGSALGLVFQHPGLLRDLNQLLSSGKPDPDGLREALFHQPIERERLMHYYRLCQPESPRAIWDMTLFDLPLPVIMHRPPMKVMGAEFDRLIPPLLVDMTARTYGVSAEIVPGVGHGLMLERDWERVATKLADWLDGLNLA